MNNTFSKKIFSVFFFSFFVSLVGASSARAEVQCPSVPDGTLKQIHWGELIYGTLGKEKVRHKFTGYIANDTISVETSLPQVESNVIVGYDTYTQHIHLGSRQVTWTSKPITAYDAPGVVKQSDYTDLFVFVPLSTGDRVKILTEDQSVLQVGETVYFVGNESHTSFGSRMYQKDTGILQGFNVPTPAPSLLEVKVCGTAPAPEPTGNGDVVLKDGFITSTPYYLSQRAVAHAIFDSPNPPSKEVLLDLELYNSQQQKIAQNWFDHATIPDQNDVEKMLDVPQFLPDGNYTFKAGVFTPEWQQLLHWYDNVQTFPLVGLGQFEDENVLMAHASAAPEVITQGQVSTLLASFFSPDTQNHALIDLELYDAQGSRVAQQFYDNVAFPRSGTGNFEGIYTMQSPVSLPKGVYTFKVGIFKPRWAGLINWYNNAATLMVE